MSIIPFDGNKGQIAAIALPKDPIELIKQAQHILEVAKDAAESNDNIIDSAMDYALELLRALDESQPEHQQRSKEWVVRRLHDLVSVLDERNGGAA